MPSPLPSPRRSRPLSSAQAAALRLCFEDGRDGWVETWRLDHTTLNALMRREHLHIPHLNLARDATQFARITDAGRAALATLKEHPDAGPPVRVDQGPPLRRDTIDVHNPPVSVHIYVHIASVPP